MTRNKSAPTAGPQDLVTPYTVRHKDLVIQVFFILNVINCEQLVFFHYIAIALQC